MDNRELERALIAVMEKIDRLEQRMNQLEEPVADLQEATIEEMVEE